MLIFSHALIMKSIHLGYLSTLMVASEQCYLIRVPTGRTTVENLINNYTRVTVFLTQEVV